MGNSRLFIPAAKDRLTFETKERRSSQESSDAIERATPAVVLRAAGAKAIAADADKSRRAADWNTFIFLICQLCMQQEWLCWICGDDRLVRLVPHS